MKVAKGYKQTDIGVIPEDWEVLKLSDLTFKIGSGITPTGGEKVYKDKGRPFIRSQNVGWGNLNLGDVAFIDDETHSTFQATEIKLNDVLLNISGASIGRSAIADERIVNGNVNQHVCIIRTNDKILNPYYLNAFLLSYKGQNLIDSFQTGGNRQGLNFGQIKTFLIAFPPNIKEQKAITKALTETDAFIADLEKLIFKKKNIKQATMQILLTGKKRLKGFTGEWKEQRFPNVCWYQEGPGVRNKQFTTSGVKLLNGTNINRGKLKLDATDRYISEKVALGFYSHFLVDDGDILIACSGITIDKFHEKVTIAKAYHLPLCMNTSTMRFKVTSKKLVKEFLFYFLQSDSFKNQIGGKATGSAQLNFGPSHVKMVSINLPEPQEQIAISNILSNIDKEIESLQQQLSKYQFMKQGMMQNLLTGKVRLV